LILQSLLDRCERSGVKLALKADGKTIRYEAPAGIEQSLKAELKANKDAIARHLGKADQIAERLAEMERDPVSRAIVHPEWHAVALGVFDDVHDVRDPLPDLATTIIELVGAARTVRELSPGERLPVTAVVWSQPNAIAFWMPGPAHALGGMR
jgi:hypothetical protein